MFISFAVLVIIVTSPLQGQEPDLELTIDVNVKHQTIRHFGSSAAFELNEITEEWGAAGLDGLAETLFSREMDAQGHPKGIGLSSFRIEIGACSREQGEASQISMEHRRADCPLRPDSSYDFSRMSAETFWVDKAHEYGLSAVFGYSNSPPVYFTKNGLACRTKDVPSANLREDCYDDFAEYLAQVALFYANRGTPLHYISPVNEPQWEWICDTQEGTKWFNTEIRDLVVELDKAFAGHDLEAKITITEGGSIDRVFGFEGDPTGNQLAFWDPASHLYIGNLGSVAPYVAGHGYWTEDTDQRLVDTREGMFQRIRETDSVLEWWQTEYSFLGDGFRDGRNNLTEIDYGLFLAKVIHHDLTLGNASAWQYWETFNYGKGLPRHKLVNVFNNQTYATAKTGWALGHYSLFVRPGMRRIKVTHTDNATSLERAQGIMSSAYINETTGDAVIVVINYIDNDRTIRLNMPGVPDTTQVIPYLTASSEFVNMSPQTKAPLSNPKDIPGRSITTFTLKSEGVIASVNEYGRQDYFEDLTHRFVIKHLGDRVMLSASLKGLAPPDADIKILDIKGVSVYQHFLVKAADSVNLQLPELSSGVYFLKVRWGKHIGHRAINLMY